MRYKLYYPDLIGDLFNISCTKSKGKIISVFNHVCNIRMGEKKGFSLIDNKTIMAPYHIRIKEEGISLKRLGLKPGMNVLVTGKKIIIPQKLILIDFEKSSIWSSDLPETSRNINRDFVYRRLYRLVEYLKKHGKNTGFGKFNSYWNDFFNGLNIDFNTPFLKRGFNILRKIVECNNYDSYKQLVEKIIGLGEGSTPSGDDFLVGWLSVINFINSKYNYILVKSLNNIDLYRMTTFISAQQLQGALRGKFNERIINFYKTFFTEEKEFFSSVNELNKLGSSSGTDILTGIIFGFFINILQ